MEELLFQRENLTFIPKILRGIWRKPVCVQLCCRSCAPVTQGAAVASEKKFFCIFRRMAKCVFSFAFNEKLL